VGAWLIAYDVTDKSEGSAVLIQQSGLEPMPAQPSLQLIEDGLVGVDAGAARNADEPLRQSDHALVVSSRLFQWVRLLPNRR